MSGGNKFSFDLTLQVLLRSFRSVHNSKLIMRTAVVSSIKKTFYKKKHIKCFIFAFKSKWAFSVLGSFRFSLDREI